VVSGCVTPNSLGFFVVLGNRLDLVELFPESGSTTFATCQNCGLRQFPYLLIYRLTPDTVQMLGLLPSRRDPEWIQQQVESRS
jgi:hypothetical protein